MILFASIDFKDVFFEELKIYNATVLQALQDRLTKSKKQYVNSTKQYIHDFYSDSSLSLHAISEHLGISQSYLSTQFKKETGTGFVDYLNLYRIDKSCWLLERTEISVEEIGFRCGFLSSKNYIRVFKKYKGCTPGEYRK